MFIELLSYSSIFGPYVPPHLLLAIPAMLLFVHDQVLFRHLTRCFGQQVLLTLSEALRFVVLGTLLVHFCRQVLLWVVASLLKLLKYTMYEWMYGQNQQDFFHGDGTHHTHTIHVWYISSHLVDFYGKCRLKYIYIYTIHGCHGI